MTLLTPDTRLTNGQTYTMSLTAGFLSAGVPVDQVTATLVNSPVVDIAEGIQTNQDFWSLKTYNVTFTYTGDGTDTVSDVFNEFANALDVGLSSFDFLACTTGTVPGTGSGAANPPTLPTTGALWAYVAIGVLLIFVASGGIGVVRSVAR